MGDFKVNLNSIKIGGVKVFPAVIPRTLSIWLEFSHHYGSLVSLRDGQHEAFLDLSVPKRLPKMIRRGCVLRHASEIAAVF